MRLAVELHGTVIGTLEGDVRSFDFLPTADGLERFNINSSVLSVAIPLVPNPRRDQASRRRNWFAELLPEGNQYDYMLRQGEIRAGDTLGFLARYGRDVAGALQLWDLDDPTEPRTPGLNPVTAADIRALLMDPIGSPLGNFPNAGKSSLGGVQLKVVLVSTDAGWAQSLGGYPTTHILKPRLDGDMASVIFDEEYGSRLARRLGLADFATSIEQFDDLPALVVERYDRLDGARVHQEDFSQALGASRNEKYQEVGGIVSLQRVAETVKRNAPEQDLIRLARMVILAVGIGNLDMHTKNISLLHPADGRVTLAPAYDMVPQTHMKNDGRMALAINKRYRHAEITRDDLEAEFGKWRLRRADVVVGETLEQLAAAVDEEAPVEGAHARLRGDVARFVGNLQHGRIAGAGGR